MCLTCGCNPHTSHDHEHKEETGHHHHHHHEHGPIGAVHAHGTDSSRILQVEEDILAENNHYAAHNRERFKAHKILALNMVSSPGSGKTSLLTHTLTAKHDKTAVIEGDQFTDRDAERLRKTGAPVIQINTGSGCHLDAHMVGHALEDLDMESGKLDGGVVYIENVGNLVCPASFDLGEAAKVVLLSVTEGEDKPIKYSHMFAASKLMLITKMDLLPYVPFDIEQCIAFAREVNPTIEVIKLSVRNNEGVQDWFDWIDTMKIA